MTLLAHILWPVLMIAATAPAPAVEPPVFLPLPDLSTAPLVRVMDGQGGDGLVVQRQDSSYLTLRLAGVLVNAEDSPRRHAAWAFLHNLLAGERVWMVREDPAKPVGTDKYYIYRWPDRLVVNLEMVRQGYADVALDKSASQAAGKAFTYWREQARVHHKGIWAVDAKAPATATAPASAPASQPAVQIAQVVADQTVVYISASGKKYHTANCRSLRSTKTPKTLDEVRKTHEPCKQCNPPR